MFYPYLTLWTYGFMAWLIGIQGTIFISTIIFPIISFYLLYKIFSRQLDKLWSIAISLTCILAFSDWPFRSFIVGIIKGLSFEELTTIQPLEITHYPIPSFSIMIFLLLFYFSTKQRKMNFTNITLFTILWGLFTYVHAVDALFGLTFWFVYFPIQIFRQSGKRINSKYIKQITSQALIALLLVLPIILLFGETSINHSIENIGLITLGAGGSLDIFYISIYFFLPIVLTIIVFAVKKVDPYEILIKFIHVYILLSVELLLVVSSMFFLTGIETDVVQTRIALFFLHFYYYTPFIYLVTRQTGYTYSQGMEANEFIRKFEIILNLIFNRLDKIYLPSIIILLFMFSGSSSYKSYKHYKEKELSIHKVVKKEYNELINSLPEGSVLVSDSPGTNLLPPIDFNNNYKTLWINKFTHNVPSVKIIDRLLLYAKIYNWPEDRVLQFFSKGFLQKGKGMGVDLSNENIYKSGIGFWFVHHKRRLDDSTLNKYLQTISNRYNNMNIDKLISEFSVTHIYSVSPISKDINIKYVQELNSGVLYHVGINQDD